MSIEEIEMIYHEIFHKETNNQNEQELFPELQYEVPSALQQIEFVTVSSSSL